MTIIALLTLLCLLLALLAGSTESFSAPSSADRAELAHKRALLHKAQRSRCLPLRQFRWKTWEIPNRIFAYVSTVQTPEWIRAARAKPNLCDPRTAIRYVFGPYAGQALAVSWCESRYDVNARNGQYRGLFQMGEWERRTFGHSSTALGQARAAYRYFVASGRDWSPWACKPPRGGVL